MARLGSWRAGQPGADPQYVDGDGGQDVPEVGLGQADVAGAPQAAGPNRL